MEDVTTSKVSLKNWKRDMRSHRANLHRIEHGSSRLDNGKPTSFSPKFHGVEHKQFLIAGKSHIERNREINIDNRRLVRHLLLISSGRPRSLCSPLGHKSLNFLSRKQAALQMTAQNVALANRLNHLSSKFSTEKWETDFHKAQKVRKQISKPHVMPAIRRNPQNAKLRRCLSGDRFDYM